MATRAEIQAAINLGVEEIGRHLNAVGGHLEPDLLSAYASGIANGLSAYFLEEHGVRNAYALFQEIADDLIELDLPKGP